jgi:hypothetical protein
MSEIANIFKSVTQNVGNISRLSLNVGNTRLTQGEIVGDVNYSGRNITKAVNVQLLGIIDLVDNNSAQINNYINNVISQYITNNITNIINEVNTLVYNTQTGNYTLSLSDQSKMVEMNVAYDCALVVPSDSNSNFPIGSTIYVSWLGSGQPTVLGQSGVNIRSNTGYYSLESQNTIVTLRKRANNDWYIGEHLVNGSTPIGIGAMVIGSTFIVA